MRVIITRVIFDTDSLFVIYWEKLFSATSIVFVHIGNSYSITGSMPSIRLVYLMPETDSYSRGNEKVLAADAYSFDQIKVKKVFLEQIPMTKTHRKRFLARAADNEKLSWYFWLYTTQRFLYLHDLMQTF